MSQLFDLTLTRPKIILDADGNGEIKFTAANPTSETQSITTKLVTLSPQHKKWISCEGDLTREFPAKSTYQYRVKIEVPLNKFQGSFEFRLDAYSSSEPNKKLTNGQSVLVETQPAAIPVVEEKKGKPWLMVAVGILVLSNVATLVTMLGGDATEADIKSGKTALVGGGMITGTLPTQSLSDSNTTVKSGYYAATTLEKVDTDLISDNLKSGVTLFGVTGNNKNVIDTSSGEVNATAKDILIGKKAWVNGKLVTGAAQIFLRYQDNGDGTVTDKRLGLIWLKNANCFGEKTWDDAVKIVQQLKSGECGLSDNSSPGDWRLPTKYEWLVMMNKIYKNGTLSDTKGASLWSKGNPFTGTKKGKYWTSNLFGFNSSRALVVNTNGSIVHAEDKTSSHYVWVVRSEKKNQTLFQGTYPRL